MKLVRIHCHTEAGEKITEFRMEYHPEILELYKELGIIDIDKDTIHYEDLRRLKKILRLKKNIGVNTIGAAVIVDLMDKIENMQDEIERLRKKVGD